MDRTMKYLKRLIFGGLLSLMPISALAGQQPVVLVELFTSQGCSSCPPADVLLQELSKSPDVLPLALHVDYWDYIGWKDVFADPAFTKRQKDYAKSHRAKSIYTPQAVINGAQGIVGSDQMALMKSIMQEHENLARIELDASFDGSGWRLDFINKDPNLRGKVEVLFVSYMDQADVKITTGENAGQTLRYVNIVTDITSLGAKVLGGDWKNFAKFPKNGHYAVILQASETGRVVAAYAVK